MKTGCLQLTIQKAPSRAPRIPVQRTGAPWTGGFWVLAGWAVLQLRAFCFFLLCRVEDSQAASGPWEALEMPVGERLAADLYLHTLPYMGIAQR